MTVAMNAQGDVRQHLIALTDDEEAAVRLAAVAALAQCQGAEVAAALRLALQDANREVRDSAASALAKRAHHAPAAQDREVAASMQPRSST
jgi:HEAT repeat protein